MITFQNITKAYNKNSIALENVSFKINPKEFVSIVGRSDPANQPSLNLLLRKKNRPTEE